MTEIFYAGFAPGRIRRFESDLADILRNLEEAEER